jgi:hypothetical protein
MQTLLGVRPQMLSTNILDSKCADKQLVIIGLKIVYLLKDIHVDNVLDSKVLRAINLSNKWFDMFIDSTVEQRSAS